MLPRERLQMVLEGDVPDRIPFDLGATPMTGIHESAYRALLSHLGYDDLQVNISDRIQQLAQPHERVLQHLKVDVRGVFPSQSDRFQLMIKETGEHIEFTDEWGIKWRMPKQGGYYFDMVSHPLSHAKTPADLVDYAWIDPLDFSRYEGLSEKTRRYAEDGFGVCHWSICPGISETHAWLRGYTNYYKDFYKYPELAEAIMDKVLEIKIKYWEEVFKRTGTDVQVAVEADDLSGQERPLISPDTYRRFIKPRHQKLFQGIKDIAPHVKVFLHSCGAVSDFIPDFIECGMDILNPVQKSAAGMDLERLKKEFGDKIVFWGGGVDTQFIFGSGTPEEVGKDTSHSIKALKPEGGFVFSPVHNTQPDVPPENYLTMWEALQEKADYKR